MDNQQTLHQLFEYQAVANPNGLAVIFHEEKLTYAELNNKANQLAHLLREQQIGPDVLVGLCIDRSVELLIAMLAVLKAGGAYIPLDKTFPEERLLLILNEANNPLLLCNNASATQFKNYSGMALNIEDFSAIASQPITNLAAINQLHHLAYVIYTSGSTGKPKGVLIEHGSIKNYAKWISTECQWHAGQRIDLSSNHAFDFALTLTIVPLLYGLTVVICPEMQKKDPLLYLAYIQQSKINTIKLTPSYFRVLLHEAQKQKLALPHLKHILLGGENLPTMDCKAWNDLYPHHWLLNEYGPTETTVAVSLYRFDASKTLSPNDNVPIGYLAPGVKAYLINDKGQLVKEGEVGELYLSGACLARGYLNNPEVTAKAFIDYPFESADVSRLYKTGDLCCLLPNGAYNCLGRIDHQIKIRGYRVELEEIEYYLCKHPAIKAAVVIASNKYTKEKSLLAYYTVKDTSLRVDNEALRRYLKTYIPDYMIPSAFVRMEAFPLNANEKLDRNALPAPLFEHSHYHVSPKTTMERRLAKIWEEELGVRSIGIKDDFFALGGHSLSAARVISKIQAVLKRQVTLLNLYQNPTIEGLAPLAETAPKPQRRKISAISYDSKLPLSDFQFTLWLTNTFEPNASKLNVYARQRINGQLDVVILRRAFAILLQKHEVLFYRAATLSPTQRYDENQSFSLHEEDLSHLTTEEQEEHLKLSTMGLMSFHPWPKDKPQLIAKLFSLDKHQAELQIALPHLISDDFSPAIIIKELASFYNSAQQTVDKDKGYKNYIIQEQDYLERYLNRDMAFWDDYLRDSSLFLMPKQHMVKKPQTYSSYIEIPEENLKHLQAFCAQTHISIIDGLSAALMLALEKTCPQNGRDAPIFVNRVKSTRHDESLDRTIGCFLRLEPIKLFLGPQLDLASLSQAIHQAVVSTDLYQKCPTIIKLASVGTFRKAANPALEWLIKTAVWLYSALIFRSEMNKKILNSIGRLRAARGAHFLININMHNNFLTHPKQSDKELFKDCEILPASPIKHDLVSIDNLLDVCFTRQMDSDKAFLVISANLEPAFREHLGQEVVRLMTSAK